MKLLTLLFSAAFSLVYLSGILPRHPLVDRALSALKSRLKYLAFAGLLAGFLGLFASPLVTTHDSELMIDILANAVLMIMALPYAFREFAASLSGKVNAAIMKEFDNNFVGFILRHEVATGIAGTALTLLLFATAVGAFNFELL